MKYAAAVLVLALLVALPLRSVFASSSGFDAAVSAIEQQYHPQQQHIPLQWFASLEAVIPFKVGGVASENRDWRGGVRRLWRVHRQERQRSQAGFSPQPFGTGPIFPVSLSLVA